MYDDWALIESSFSQQYGIRLRLEDDMTWSEFSSLLSGLLPDSPLGQIMSIRSENDPDVLKNFNSDQHRIRNEWRSRVAKQMTKNEDEAKQATERFQEMMRKAFANNK